MPWTVWHARSGSALSVKATYQNGTNRKIIENSGVYPYLDGRECAWKHQHALFCAWMIRAHSTITWTQLSLWLQSDN